CRARDELQAFGALDYGQLPAVKLMRGVGLAGLDGTQPGSTDRNDSETDAAAQRAVLFPVVGVLGQLESLASGPADEFHRPGTIRLAIMVLAQLLDGGR